MPRMPARYKSTVLAEGAQAISTQSSAECERIQGQRTHFVRTVDRAH